MCRACVCHATSIPLCSPTSPNVLIHFYAGYIIDIVLTSPHAHCLFQGWPLASNFYVRLYIMIIDDVHSHDLVKLMVHVVTNSHVMGTNPLNAFHPSWVLHIVII